MDGVKREVYRLLREAQDKYTYFMLTAAGGAVALVVNQTQGAILQWSQLLLGAAVLFWGVSFYFGCQHLRYISLTLYGNFDLLRVEAGEHPITGNDPQRIADASEGIRRALQGNINRASRYALWQFRLLVGGAVLYVLWHVLEMWLRTVRH